MMFRWYTYLFAGLALGIVFFAVSLYHRAPAAGMYDRIVGCAKQESDAMTVACLRSTVRDLLRDHTATELMAAISTSSLPTKFGGCHSIGHFIGSETYRKLGNTEETLRQCTNACNYSCIHGAIGEVIDQEFGDKYQGEDIAHASVDEISSIGSKYCKDPRLCHVVGHLLYIAAQNNLTKALGGCASITPSAFLLERCEGGVYMQFSGGLETSLILGQEPAPKPELPERDYLFPCDTIDPRFQHECFIQVIGLSNRAFQKNGITDAKEKVAALKEACTSNSLDRRGRSACFEATGLKSGMSKLVADGSVEAAKFCDQFDSSDDRKSCVLGRVYWLLHYRTYTDGVNYCAEQNAELQDLCYRGIFKSFDVYFAASDDGPVMCERANNGDLCRQKQAEYQKIRHTIPDYPFGLFGD